jgi:hypothetical protein
MPPHKKPAAQLDAEIAASLASQKTRRSWDPSILGITQEELSAMDAEDRETALIEALNRAADQLQAVVAAFGKDLCPWPLPQIAGPPMDRSACFFFVMITPNGDLRKTSDEIVGVRRAALLVRPSTRTSRDPSSRFRPPSRADAGHAPLR